ncbi:MAG: S-adenosylmethionine uptake transporter [Rhodobacteraceae bacterium HLUCCA08]|nr:MAG: S-adenosylmethionine uptake transporter [Rhodobacteraceae bacterium HLUCCA08]
MTSLADTAAQARNGIAFILIGMLCVSINDLIIAVMSGGYPLHQMVFSRAVIGIGLTLLLLRHEGGLHLLRTRQPLAHAARALLVVLSNMTYFAALSVMPLAMATALFFVAPLFITLLSIPFLGETVGLRRMMAVLVGFLGVLVMIRIEGGAPLWAYPLPMLAALFYAVMQILTRRLGVASSAAAMAFYIQGAFLLVSAGFFVVAGDGRFAETTPNEALQFLLRAWTWPEPADWARMVVLGLSAGIVSYALSRAYRVADAAVIAPFEYVALPLAIFWGWLVLEQVPDQRTLLGAALIVGSGVYVFVRERSIDSPQSPVAGPRRALRRGFRR